MKKMTLVSSLYLLACFVNAAFAEDLNSNEMQHHMQAGMYGVYPSSRESSGTSWQPDSSPVEAIVFMHNDWMFMLDGFVDVTYDHQGGKRGGDKTFSSSMFMLMAERESGKNKFGFRSMFSLDPLMGKRGYPLLLQTGETADGVTPLIDRQHPHDFVMEMAPTYSLALSQESSAFLYFGLPGEPALGPPAFVHRFSGMEIPEAPISHHWLDSTHITYGVGTIGYIWKKLKIESSVFKGREPNQNRWDIESPKFDSYSARVSFNPAQNWALQASYGYLDSPEQLEPDTDTGRLTVSAIYNKAFQGGNWQSIFAWGQDNNHPGHNLNAYLLETAISFRDKHTFFNRLERVDKDELFLQGNPLAGEVFKVNKISFGYAYYFPASGGIQCGIGGSFQLCILPGKLDSAYGDTPKSYMVFARMKFR